MVVRVAQCMLHMFLIMGERNFMIVCGNSGRAYNCIVSQQ